MTKMSHDGHYLIPAFMASGVFCFAVSVLFMLSGVTGGDINHPLSMVTNLICQ